MSRRSKKPIWLLFKLTELLLMTINCYIHMSCFNKNGIPHIFILCATYGGGFVLLCITLLGTMFITRVPVKMEAMMSGVIGSLCLMAVYANMYVAEHDQLLSFLKDREEGDYGFLTCCRNSGVLSLWSAGIHFLHCSFALDMLLTHAPSLIETLADGSQIALQSQRSKRPLRLYFISQPVESYLMNFRLFQFLFTTNVLARDRNNSSLYAFDQYYSEISVVNI